MSEEEIPIIVISEHEDDNMLDDVIRTFCDDEELFGIYKSEIMKCHKPYVIAELLREYHDMDCQKLTESRKYNLAMITRDLKKLESPIIPNILTKAMFEYIYSRPWSDWTVWDVEREYLDVLMCRGETSDFAPADKFTNRQIIEMLDLLVNCDVIYNFKWVDVADDWEDCFSDDEFQNTKKIRVQAL